MTYIEEWIAEYNHAGKCFDCGMNTDAVLKLVEEARREERERIVAWAKEQEWDAKEEANDPTKDFVAHDAYESKAEAWFYGYNEALKELRDHLLSDK